MPWRGPGPMPWRIIMAPLHAAHLHLARPRPHALAHHHAGPGPAHHLHPAPVLHHVGQRLPGPHHALVLHPHPLHHRHLLGAHLAHPVHLLLVHHLHVAWLLLAGLHAAHHAALAHGHALVARPQTSSWRCCWGCRAGTSVTRPPAASGPPPGL